MVIDRYLCGMEVIGLLVGGAVLGALIVYFWQSKVRAALNEAKQLTAANQATIVEKDKVLQGLEDEVDKINADRDAYQKRCTAAETRVEEQKEYNKKLFEHHKNDFKQIAQEITDKSIKQLSNDSVDSLSNEVKPLKEQLEAFRKANEVANTQRSEQHGALKQQITDLSKQSGLLGEKAHALTQALSSNKAQGDWGEMVLKELLELSGLQEGEHYSFQENLSIEDDKGKRKLLRPDVVVHMPEDRAIVIDAKTSLDAYTAYMNTEGEAKALALEQHITSLKNHIKGLQKKDYVTALNKDKEVSVDYVLMFVPIEGALFVALQKDKELFSKAMRGPVRVVLVSATMLMPTLRIVDSMWRLGKQGKNAQEIAKVGGAIYDKLAKFVEHVEKIGKHLGLAQEAYGEAHKRLKSDRKDDIKQLAAQIKRLGASSKNELPPAYQIDQLDSSPASSPQQLSAAPTSSEPEEPEASEEPDDQLF